jgi:pimeloyl-ACP methyl ester carboxylesterase
MSTKPTPIKSGHVAANGLNYYYEVHGQGEPLLLLHGGFGSIDMFGPVLTRLAAEREVIGVDLQGHGRTDLGERAMDMSDMGDDMAQILAKLGHDKVDVMGFSFGSAVALELAVAHPERVRHLVLVSACYSTDGVYPEMLHLQGQLHGGLAEAMKDTPTYKSYASVAARPEDFPKLLDRMGDLMKKPVNVEDKGQAVDHARHAGLRRR